MKAYIFPGQGAQFPGMGKDLYHNCPRARELFGHAEEILGFSITSVMFKGPPGALQETHVTQLAVFLHSVILSKTSPCFQPDMVAGHSLGELSALVANQTLTFEAGLHLVNQRAKAMQMACESHPGTMAAILGLSDKEVEQACQEVDEPVVLANYNCPGQCVISGSNKGVALACARLKEVGAKKIIPLPVSGAFHSPLMQPAQERFSEAITQTEFHQGICPVYLNARTTPTAVPEVIKENLMRQLTSPVRWTATIQCMIEKGAHQFVECGPGSVLQGLVKKTDATVTTCRLD